MKGKQAAQGIPGLALQSTAPGGGTGMPTGSPATSMVVSPGRILKPCLKVGRRRHRARHTSSGLGGGGPAVHEGQAVPGVEVEEAEEAVADVQEAVADMLGVVSDAQEVIADAQEVVTGMPVVVEDVPEVGVDVPNVGEQGKEGVIGGGTERAAAGGWYSPGLQSVAHAPANHSPAVLPKFEFRARRK